ncbi:uncharacterized protein BCR38DRAFT_421544 [Pseudomassariella vexata]|uniref:F-box domain-containing protein n=1 Tax=Pseudomassariella vexata TaxID=1141098 RepID=A0A1Y2EHJ7_9PEZI|nr:uncharacterized protein BCR38DRAFT_421544 [Pseudomassariella vexata]ORY70255.1 hypothetical protein BCR38DRAFT_421544 [Pseudomassariella vexata]
MNLLDLPNELLCSLPNYMRDIEDFVNAASTCRKLRDVCHAAHPNTILRLAASSAPTFFSPHPYFLVAATCRQVADWAVGDTEKTAQLNEAFQGGIDGLYDLCIAKAGLTLPEISRLHLSRFTIFNPLGDKIDKMAGRQWYATPNFWEGGVSEPNTVDTDVDRAVFQILIYSELFSGFMKAVLEPEKQLPKFDLDTRFEYIKYCVPDWNCARGYEGMRSFATGPYDPSFQAMGKGFWPPADQVALSHILSCSRWTRLWDHVLEHIGPAFEEDWKQELWRNAPLTLGWEWFQLVTVFAERELSDKWRARLSDVRSQVDALDGQRHVPQKRVFTKRHIEIYDIPILGREVEIPMAAYYPPV